MTGWILAGVLALLGAAVLVGGLLVAVGERLRAERRSAWQAVVTAARR